MRRVPAAMTTTAVASLALVATLLGAGPSGATDAPAAPAPATATATPTLAPTTAPTATPTPTTAPTAAPTSSAPVSSRKVGKKGKAPDKFTPKDGVKFNDPLGSSAKKRKLLGQLIRTINSVPRGEEIRIASWNIRSQDVADALIAAYNRGVSVQAVMDNLNAKADNRNIPVNRMIGAFASSKKRKSDPLKRSSVIKCLSSCRSSSGIAHTKFFLFSRAGKASDVVMYGSNNATDLAAYYQWNDLYTVVDSPTLYAEFEAVFYQMRKDKFYKQPYLTYDHPELVPPLTTYFYPYVGEGATGDPLISELDKIQCTGAAPGYGTGDGRTRVRIAQTSMHSKRGLQIATKLRQMWEQGCDVKIVYAVFGNNVLKVLRNTTRGPVPIRQIAQDFNLDGVYDRYLHLKDMAVNGVYDGNPAAQVTWNGSANWTSVALASDEIVGKIVDPAIEAKYAKWVDTLYANPPRYRGRMATLATVARMGALSRGVSPESGIEEN